MVSNACSVIGLNDTIGLIPLLLWCCKCLRWRVEKATGLYASELSGAIWADYSIFA